MYQKIKQKLSRGSILGATLIILGLMLVSALSFALVSVREKKASTGANKSNQALQTAGTGVEKVMQLIKNNGDDTVASIDKDGACDGVINNSAEGYAVQLQDDAGDIVPCASSVSAVKKVKSVGTIGGNQRAVEVAVAGSAVPIGTCFNPDDMLFIQFAPSCPSGFSQCSVSQLAIAAKKGCLPILSQSVLTQANISLADMVPNYWFGSVRDLTWGQAVVLMHANPNWTLISLGTTPGYYGGAVDKACCHLGL